MSKFVCKREDVCAGKLFKKNNISYGAYFEDGSVMNADELEEKGYKYDRGLYCRHILFNIDIHNLANDLVYKSPLYPIEEIYPTIDFDSDFVVEDMVNLEKVLKYMNYNKSLTQEDIRDIYKKLIAHKTWLKKNYKLFGLEKGMFQQFYFTPEDSTLPKEVFSKLGTETQFYRGRPHPEEKVYQRIKRR